MGLLQRMFGRRASEESLGTLQNPSNDLYKILAADDGGGGATSSGVSVTERKAESLSAMYCGVRIISEMGSAGPINVYSREKKGEIIRTHSAYRLLRKPNKYQTAMSLRESMFWCANVWGGGFAEIERRSNGDAVALHFVHSSNVSIDDEAMQKNELRWRISGNGAPRFIDDADMFHLKGPGEGITGKPVVRILRETLGRALGVRQHGSVYFNNGGRLQVLLKHPLDLDEDKAKGLVKGFQKMFSGGADGKQKVGLMTGGLDLATGGIFATNNEDAQFLETEHFGIEEVCRVLNIQPHLVKHLLRATNNNIEHQGLEFYTVTMLPWFKRFEEEAERKLLSESEQETVYMRHNADFILRGDFKSRMEGHALAISWGMKTRDEIRELEDIAPLADGLGEIPLVPATHKAAQVLRYEADNPEPPDDTPPEPDTSNGDDQPEPEPDDNRTADPLRVKSMLRDIIQAAVDRMARVESDKMQRASKKPETYQAWTAKFVEDHRNRVNDELAAPVSALLELSGNTARPSIIREVVDSYMERLGNDLKTVDSAAFVGRNIDWIMEKAG